MTKKYSYPEIICGHKNHRLWFMAKCWSVRLSHPPGRTGPSSVQHFSDRVTYRVACTWVKMENVNDKCGQNLDSSGPLGMNGCVTITSHYNKPLVTLSNGEFFMKSFPRNDKQCKQSISWTKNARIRKGNNSWHCITTMAISASAWSQSAVVNSRTLLRKKKWPFTLSLTLYVNDSCY